MQKAMALDQVKQQLYILQGVVKCYILPPFHYNFPH